MLTERLQRRVPSARALGVGRLPQHTICFHKRSDVDGSGKCTIYPVRDEAGAVFGVLFDVDAAERSDLDRIEGVGYDARAVTVLTEDGTASDAYTYVARASHLDDALRPFAWYKALVLAGARQHDLPAPYVATLRDTASWRDSDVTRRQRHCALLAAARS